MARRRQARRRVDCHHPFQRVIGIDRRSGWASREGIAERVVLLEVRVLRRRIDVLDRRTAPRPHSNGEPAFLARLPDDSLLRCFARLAATARQVQSERVSNDGDAFRSVGNDPVGARSNDRDDARCRVTEHWHALPVHSSAPERWEWHINDSARASPASIRGAQSPPPEYAMSMPSRLPLSRVLAAGLLALTAPISARLPAQRGAGGGRGGLGDTLSLPTPRPLRFTTDEGTWMSVDVSPDGRTLVFDFFGDLHHLRFGGGQAKRFTSGQGFDAMPAFSPDGSQIAFVSDRNGSPNLWVANADGTRPRQLSRTEGFGYDYVSPSWTLDGRGILVSHNNGPAQTGLTLRGFTPFDLYLFTVAGGQPQRLTGGGQAPTPQAGGRGGGGGGATSHLGARFASPTVVWYASVQNPQVFTLDLETGKSTRRVSWRAGAFRPVPSPDGKWLVYATRRNDATALRVRDLASGDERWLKLDAQQDMMGTKPTRDLMPGMAFTPDSKSLIASAGGKLWRIAVPSGEATAIPFTADVDQMMGASTQFQYAFNDSTVEVRQIRFPRISPDGQRVTFTALDRVWVVHLPAN